jgi:hypothetical protein
LPPERTDDFKVHGCEINYPEGCMMVEGESSNGVLIFRNALHVHFVVQGRTCYIDFLVVASWSGCLSGVQY